jgi:hypothetical protein
VTVKQNGLVHRYDRLEPEERFRAALEAAAREDEDERRHLADTCPRKDYRMTDAAYLDRVDASRDLACAVVIAIAPEMAQARLLTVVSELTAQTLATTMACHVLADARRDADPDTVLADFDAALAEELPKAKEASVYCGLKTVRGGLLSKAAAAYTAFSEVCRDELGLEPVVVLSAHVGAVFVDTIGLDYLDGVKPHQKALAAWREVLGRTWRERVA